MLGKRKQKHTDKSMLKLSAVVATKATATAAAAALEDDCVDQAHMYALPPKRQLTRTRPRRQDPGSKYRAASRCGPKETWAWPPYHAIHACLPTTRQVHVVKGKKQIPRAGRVWPDRTSSEWLDDITRSVSKIWSILAGRHQTAADWLMFIRR